MFKTGDKVKLKKTVTFSMLRNIGLYPEDLKGFGVVVGNSAFSNYSDRDLNVRFSSYDFILPEKWLEKLQRPGHHLTKIFQ